MCVGAAQPQLKAEAESRVAGGVFRINQDRPGLELLRRVFPGRIRLCVFPGRIRLLRSASFEAPEFVLAFLQDHTFLEIKG
jgi:hypothetical protein